MVAESSGIMTAIKKMEKLMRQGGGVGLPLNRQGRPLSSMVSSFMNVPDIDIDLEGRPMQEETLTIEGKDYPVPPLENYRYVVYDKQIQHIRNPESFIEYHKNNTGSLEHLMTNMVWAQLLHDTRLEAMYSMGHNQHHIRIAYNLHQDSKGYFPSGYGMASSMKQVPLRVLIEKTQRWFQGIIIEAHGAQGFDLIKRAKEAAGEKFKIESENKGPADVLVDVVEQEIQRLSGGAFIPESYKDALSISMMAETGVPKTLMGTLHTVKDRQGNEFILRKNR